MVNPYVSFLSFVFAGHKTEIKNNKDFFAGLITATTFANSVR
jgi:hypothetical protein